tara:strand:- start:809 stop:1489 length:681 start_codon:yes stop_codon:yes gene_type:complete
MEFEIAVVNPKLPVGWLEVNLPKSVMERLQGYVEIGEETSVNHNAQLAGNISKSLLIKDKDKWFFKNIINPLIGKFIELYPLYQDSINVITESAPYCLDGFWVNFQKEYEFNPFHNHSGIWSFVVWVKIPTDWREQHALSFSANSNIPLASDFEFLFPTILGDITRRSYQLDQKSEGCMLFFPAKLKHAVYPFYNCDKERVSISGNIKIDISENSMKELRSNGNCR